MTDEYPGRRSAEPARLTVGLGERSYEVITGSGLLSRAAALMAPWLKRRVAAIITDENVAGHYLQPLSDNLSAAGVTSSALVLAPGERSKSFATWERVMNWLLSLDMERGDLIIALGGGVIGDLAGFAAATLRRGTPYIQIPTSLLAQVDSSVGGKTGINTAAGKNLVGAFWQPKLVIADTDALSTLSDRHLRAGYAEVVKYGALGDAEFFSWLEARGPALLAGDAEVQQFAISASCAMKARIVHADEFEQGERALLNLGHTFGHALEAATGYSDILYHGEAVSIGMILAFRLSEQLGLCSNAATQRIYTHLSKSGLPVSITDIRLNTAEPADLVGLMRRDKKVRDGRITFVLATGIGHARLQTNVDEGEIMALLTQELSR